MNIAAHMIRAGRAYRDHPAVASGTTVLRSYGDLTERIRRLAGAFQQVHQLEPGDRVALMLHNCPQYLELLYAAWHAGLVVVPINAKLHHTEFEYILNNSSTKLCLVSGNLLETAKALTCDTLQAIIDVGSDGYQQLLAAPAAALVERSPDDPALAVLYQRDDRCAQGRYPEPS